MLQGTVLQRQQVAAQVDAWREERPVDADPFAAYLTRIAALLRSEVPDHMEPLVEPYADLWARLHAAIAAHEASSEEGTPE